MLGGIPERNGTRVWAIGLIDERRYGIPPVCLSTSLEDYRPQASVRRGTAKLGHRATARQNTRRHMSARSSNRNRQPLLPIISTPE